MPIHTDFFTAGPPVQTAGAAVADPLDPYVPSGAKPWNAARVAHLYRRLGFGATVDQIQQGLLLQPSELVDQLLDTAASLPAPTAPAWASEPPNPNNTEVENQRREMRVRWLSDMLNEGVRAKMALFWHNHFVTELFGYGCNAYLWQYYALLHTRAFGNFREFTLEMGKNPAMLVYLNSNVNKVGEPNENYARELMELFTLGEGQGYTQFDVVEMARALTGWKADFNDCYPPFFNDADFDNNPKTIFGKTANYDFDSAHYLIFSERPDEVSQFIAGKLYRHFVRIETFYPVLQGIAQTLRDENWAILPAVKKLVKSEYFFDDETINAHIRSPLETLMPVLKLAGASYPATVDEQWFHDISFWCQRLGQEIYAPPNVAGWEENRSWINESTLTGRWNYAALAIQLLAQKPDLLENLRNTAKALTNSSSDPALITAALVEYFTGQKLNPLLQLAAEQYFKAGVPANYFTNGIWNLDYAEVPFQIINLWKYVAKLPEYQLT